MIGHSYAVTPQCGHTTTIEIHTDAENEALKDMVLSRNSGHCPVCNSKVETVSVSEVKYAPVPQPYINVAPGVVCKCDNEYSAVCPMHGKKSKRS